MSKRKNAADNLKTWMDGISAMTIRVQEKDAERGRPMYKVVATKGFYEDMIGKLVFRTPKTVLLEFEMKDTMGGTHRVMFFDHQVEEFHP